MIVSFPLPPSFFPLSCMPMGIPTAAGTWHCCSVWVAGRVDRAPLSLRGALGEQSGKIDSFIAVRSIHGPFRSRNYTNMDETNGLRSPYYTHCYVDVTAMDGKKREERDRVYLKGKNWPRVFIGQKLVCYLFNIEEGRRRFQFAPKKGVLKRVTHPIPRNITMNCTWSVQRSREFE